jgi:hypothetical protein
MKNVRQDLGMRCSGRSLATAAWRSWKRAGPITPRSLDRNELLLNILQMCSANYGSELTQHKIFIFGQ